MTREEQAAASRRYIATGSRVAHAGPGGEHASPAASVLPRSKAASYYARRGREERRKRLLKHGLLAAAGVVAAVVVAVLGYSLFINSKLSSGLDAQTLLTLTSTGDDKPFYMLLLGVDRSAEREETEGTSDSAYRADTIILARVDPTAPKLTLISIPRDTKVEVRGSTHKLSEAYSLGGQSQMIEAVQDLAGIKISHYAEIDFDSFEQIVDGIGGIDVDLPEAVSDPDYTGLDLAAGEQHLDGYTALMLCRSRHAYDAYEKGDLYRAANQRMVIGAIVKKALSGDPATITGLVNTLADAVTTDMTVSTISALALSMSGIDVDTDVYSGQCPTTSSYENDLWYEVVDQSAWKEIMERVDEGLTPYSSSDQDTTAGVAGSVGLSSDDGDVELSGTVTVYNSTDVSGLAADVASTLTRAGFTATAETYTEGSLSTSVIVYNEGSEAKAQGVAQTLGKDVTIQANDGSYSYETDVVLVLGEDFS